MSARLSGLFWLAFLFLPFPAAAIQPAADVRIIDMPLSQVLNVLEADLDVQFVGQKSARDRVTDLYLSGTADVVIDTLMRHMRMDAFSFNGSIYYSPTEERAVRLVPLPEGISALEARAALQAANLIFPGFEVNNVANGGALVLSGPVQYLALCEGVLGALAPVPNATPSGPLVRRGGVLEAADAGRGGSLSSTN